MQVDHVKFKEKYDEMKFIGAFLRQHIKPILFGIEERKQLL